MEDFWFNRMDDHGETPMSRVTKTAHQALIDLILRQEEDYMAHAEAPEDRPDYWGAQDAMTKMLDEGYTGFHQDEYGDTPFLKAVRDGESELVDEFIKSGADVNQADNGGMTGLHWAAMNGRKDLADSLLDQGADVNAREEYAGGITPMGLAVLMGYDALVDEFKLQGGIF